MNAGFFLAHHLCKVGLWVRPAALESRPKPRCALTQNVTLSPIHYRAVQRIYGEHGQQMVKLVRENPAYAIPIVFKRLKQKDLEWCAVTNLGQGQGHGQGEANGLDGKLTLRRMHLFARDSSARTLRHAPFLP